MIFASDITLKHFDKSEVQIIDGDFSTRLGNSVFDS
jgi:hypothetical protein